jgi:hypothetical protein
MNSDPEEKLDNYGAKPRLEREEETHAHLLCLPKRCPYVFGVFRDDIIKKYAAYWGFP